MLAIAVWNLKGGTGKSTTTINLGSALARLKVSTLLIDLDGQRTASFGLGVDGQSPDVIDWLMKGKADPLSLSTALAMIPGNIEMFRLSESKDLIGLGLKGIRPLGFDVCLMDCPPNLGLVSVQAVMNCDRVLLPTLTEPASLKGLSEAISLIRGDSPDKPVEVLRSRYKRNLVLTREADDLLITGAEDLGYRLLHTAIPENIAVAECVAQQRSVIDYAGSSTGATAFKSLAKEVKKIWGL